MKRLKIALISDWFLPRIGGVEVHLRDLAHRLLHLGYEAQVITSTPGPQKVDGIIVHRLDLRLQKSLDITCDAKTIPQIEKVFSQEQFDLIHGHGLASSLAHLGMLISNEQNIANVMTSHSMLPETKYEKWLLKSIPFLLQFISTPVFRRLIRFKAVHPKYLTAVSTVAAEELSNIYGGKDVQVIPNAIDLNDWFFSGPAKPTLNIVSVMRLTPLKRATELIEMIPSINDQLGHQCRPYFKIIGDGPLRPVIEEKIKSLGIGDQVELLGTQSKEQIKQAFKTSRFFILPSRKEGFGIAALEARSFGLPVISMNHGGIRDIISHGKDGFLCDSDEEFIRRVADLTQNDFLWAKMCRAASHSMERFSWKKILPQYQSIYEKAIQSTEPEAQKVFFRPNLDLAPSFERKP